MRAKGNEAGILKRGNLQSRPIPRTVSVAPAIEAPAEQVAPQIAGTRRRERLRVESMLEDIERVGIGGSEDDGGTPPEQLPLPEPEDWRRRPRPKVGDLFGVAARIDDYRRLLGLSGEELRGKLGLSRGQFHTLRYLKSAHANILVLMMKAFPGLSITWLLLGGDRSPYNPEVWPDPGVVHIATIRAAMRGWSFPEAAIDIALDALSASGGGSGEFAPSDNGGTPALPFPART